MIAQLRGAPRTSLVFLTHGRAKSTDVTLCPDCAHMQLSLCNALELRGEVHDSFPLSLF